MVIPDDVLRYAKPRLLPHGARAFVALALVLCGAGAIVYAAAFHVIPVQSAPPKPEAGQPGEPAVEAALPAEAAPAQPVTVMESEPALVREVSVSGVALAPSGEIQRTYSGQAPSQCVT
jgi:hypothetical protein